MGGFEECRDHVPWLSLATVLFGVPLSDIKVVYGFGPKCPKKCAKRRRCHENIQIMRSCEYVESDI